MANQAKYRFDRDQLIERFANTTWRGKASFAMCCASRILQVYAQSPLARPKGGPVVLDRIQRESWELIKAEAPDPAVVDRVLRDCEGLIPELYMSEESAIMATMLAIRCIVTNSAEDSVESASHAFELVYGAAKDAIGLRVIRASDAAKLETVEDNPLVQRELFRQERDLVEIEAAEKDGIPYAAVVPVLMQRAQVEAKDFLRSGG